VQTFYNIRNSYDKFILIFLIIWLAFDSMIGYLNSKSDEQDETINVEFIYIQVAKDSLTGKCSETQARAAHTWAGP